MDACLACGCNYMDTANYEPKDEAHFEYSWQWAYKDKFEQAGLCAILGCGFDPGGVLISPEFTPVYGQLGTTFGGNHLACTAALAVLDVFEKENLVENAHEVGEYLIAQLKELQKRNSHITEVRGRGLMVGAVLDIPHKEVRSKLIHEQHCFTGCAGTNILRILPPLVLTKENVDDFIGRLETVLKEV